MFFYMLLAALAPAIICGVYIYTHDRKAPEPTKLLLKTFGYGILSIPVALLLASLLTQAGLVPEEMYTFGDCVATAFFGAAIPEEIAKLLMLLLVLRRHKREFDQHIDGIVYAAFLSLGFAALENIAYIFEYADEWVSTAVVRALMAVPGHMLDGIVMGYFVSLALFDKAHSARHWSMALIGPILAHGIYDTLAMWNSTLNGFTAALVMVAFILFFAQLWKYAIRKIASHRAQDDGKA